MSATAAAVTGNGASGKGAISIRNVTKIYDPGGADVLALDDCSLEIASGEVCMIVGPSGCGIPKRSPFSLENLGRKRGLWADCSRDNE